MVQSPGEVSFSLASEDMGQQYFQKHYTGAVRFMTGVQLVCSCLCVRGRAD